MAQKILLRKGPKANIPGASGDVAEPLVTTDTHELFFGNGAGGTVPLKIDASNVTNLPAGGGAVTSVAGKTGDVTLNTSDVAEGSNLYYTDARADARVSAALADAVIDGGTF